MKQSSDASFAPGTIATDGKHVCAIFVNADVACLDMSGKVLWKKALGAPDNSYGHASSLLIAGDNLIVQFDQGSGPNDGKSKLIALDLAKGAEKWSVKRPVSTAWATPVHVKTGGKELIITAGNPSVIAHDAKTGAIVWKTDCLSGEVAPSPAFGAGFVFVANMGAELVALNPETGAVAWKTSDLSLPDTSSPLFAADMLFLCSPDGTTTCVDAKTGKKLWENPFANPARSTPILVGDRVLLFDSTGIGNVFAPEAKFKVLGAYPLGEPVSATPAFAGGKLFVRTQTHLFCIGTK
jgi:outer membrane protein assembly factor BamB